MGNNPVVGVDPDGEWVQMAIGAAISAVSYTASVAFSKGSFDNWNWKQFGVSVAVGAISGAVASGIGDAASQINNVYGRAAFQAIAHGHTGGVMAGLQGGSYKSGFLTGAASSVLGSTTGKLGPVGQIGASTVFGGAVAEFSGGNFWRGAAQSAIVAGLNHWSHQAEESIDERRAWRRFREKHSDFVVNEEDYHAVNGIKYVDGEFRRDWTIEHHPITGVAPAIGTIKGGYTLIKHIGKFNVWQKTVKASELSGQARSVMTQMRTQSGKMVKMFKDTYRIDGRFYHRSIKYPYIEGLKKYLK